MADKKKIGIIGAGRMATALASGFLRGGLSDSSNLKSTDVFENARTQFEETTGCPSLEENCDIVKNSEIIILAVKPQYVQDVCDEIANDLNESQLVISIAAGISISQIETVIGGSIPVVRVMPNTPCLIGEGANAFSLGSFGTDDHSEIVKELFNTVGTIEEVPEYQLDAVTGLSGSGPAYVFQFIEALSDGGVLKGLPRDLATRLATQTVLGAAKLLQETGEHPGVLKDGVASPGGTTIAGLQALENGKLRATVINAVQSATERSIELRK